MGVSKKKKNQNANNKYFLVFWESCTEKRLNRIMILTCTWNGFGNIYSHQIPFLWIQKAHESDKWIRVELRLTQWAITILSNSISPFKSNNRYRLDFVASRVTTKLIHNFWYIDMQLLSDRPSVLRMYLNMQ